MSWAELRTRAAAIDPGHTRLHMASVATASMVVTAALMSVLRVYTGQPVTIVMFAVVLAMITNLAVNDPVLAQRRVTTALMLVPAMASATVSSLLASQRVVADIVFVLVMMGAVAIRRYGPRYTALGMAAFMPYFFVQFLQVGPAELPYLLAGAVAGIGTTFVLRCLIFTERPDRLLDRLLRAFEARLHALALSVLDVLEAGHGEADLDQVRLAQARLNETSLLVTDRLEDAEDGPSATESELAGLRQWIVDSELAAERLAVSTRRMAEHHDPVSPEHRGALAGGVRALVAATSVGTPREMAASRYRTARSSVHQLVDATGGADSTARVQRIAFAVVRVADAMQTTVEQVQRRIADQGTPGRADADDAGDTGAAADADPKGSGTRDDEPVGLALHTRQAVQVGVATSLAIVVGELVSPARWYWAVIAAFIVFAGASSRGDVLSRGWERVIGTAGGVVAGMLLALLVGGNALVSLVLLFVCVFLALYLVRISQAMMAFWLTTVLALLYGVIGQFSVATLVLRVEETAIGGLLGMLAAFVILPTRSRTAFGDALDEALEATGTALSAAVDRIVERPVEQHPMDLARELDAAVSTLRVRARPLEHPIARRPLRRGVRHTVRVVAGMDHYVRMLAALSRTARDPAWAGTLDPAVARVRQNLEGLRAILRAGYGTSRAAAEPPPVDGGERPGHTVRSAEDLIDAAEADASAAGSTRNRIALLGVARMLRRIDQLAVGLSRELTGQKWVDPAPPATKPEASPDERPGAR